MASISTVSITIENFAITHSSRKKSTALAASLASLDVLDALDALDVLFSEINLTISVFHNVTVSKFCTAHYIL